MKRALATIVTLGTLLGYSLPAYATPYKPRSTARLELRAVKRAALASYTGRHNRGYVRARFNELVRGMMASLLPSQLAQTGQRESDTSAPARPSTRYLDDLTLQGQYGDHCVPLPRLGNCFGDNN